MTEYHEIEDQITMNYKYSMGGQSRFFTELKDNKRILGAKCNKCNTVYCPPRVACAKCYEQTEWVLVKDVGEIKVSTLVWYTTSAFIQNIPYAVGYIQLEGANTAINQGIFSESLVPSKIRPGKKVRAVFKKEREGKITDFFFVPIDEYDAAEMINELKGKQLLEGFRNMEVDKKLVIDLLLKISELGQELSDYIDQMDLNPVFVYRDNLCVIDAKLILK